MTRQAFNLDHVHPSWINCIQAGLKAMDSQYLAELTKSSDWLPGSDKIFNAFSIPLDKTNYVLFGESPYPRPESANGYAFWDQAVEELWSPTGLNKKVNRATSLRNMIKMLLLAEGLLKKNKTDQESIAQIPKENLVKTNGEFFSRLLQHGFLLLNATPVLHLQTGSPQKDARAWHPFVKSILDCLIQKNPNIQLILFGRIANDIEPMVEEYNLSKICSEHPYNISFITNHEVLSFFRPFHLLASNSFVAAQ